MGLGLFYLFRVYGVYIRTRVWRFRASAGLKALGFRVKGNFDVEQLFILHSHKAPKAGLGFRVQGSGFRVQGET